MTRKPRGFTRRDVLEISGAAVVGGVLVGCGDGAEPTPNDGAELRRFDVDRWREEPSTFPHGIQAGAMTDSSAILWTHAMLSEVYLYVFRDADEEGFKNVVVARQVDAEGGYVKVRVTGLGPGRYQYLFSSSLQSGDPVGSVSRAFGERSAVGTFRTAFAKNDTRPLRIAGLTCSSLRKRPFTALDLATNEAPDLLLHLGDMSYNDEATSLFEYREKWRATLAEPEYQRVLATAGFYFTWDDHEIDNDFNPERMAIEEPVRLAAAKEACFEALAIDRGEDDRIWRSYRWGRTAEIFIVDSRTERRPSTRNTDHPIYISDAQMAWLKNGLARSEAHYKLVMNSVPMTKMAEIWDFAAYDRWAGYQAQRKELLDHLIAEDVENVVFLSGDFHCGFVGRIEPKGEARRYWEIAVGPTGNGPNPLPAFAESGELPEDEIFPRDQFPYYSSTDSAMTFIDLDAKNGSLRVRFVDGRPDTYGNVLFDRDLSDV